MDCLSIRLKEGALINDVVTEEEAVKEVLNGIRKRYGKYRRHVYLTMSGNQIITKVLRAPRMPHSQMLELVRREISDLILPQRRAATSMITASSGGKTGITKGVPSSVWR